MANKQIHLLLVDDEPSLREFVSATLVAHGYLVAAAKDGLDALDRLAESLPDVIISDLRMPRMSGFELLAVVRRRFPHVPVIATSGEFWGGKLPTEVLADAYLEKGNYTANQLYATIAGLVAASPMRPQLAAIGAGCGPKVNFS
jgi:CheY-like chemotaxis protein